jgi:hypothetical protein
VVQRTPTRLPELYAEDETAWLEEMADRIAAGERDSLDFASLQEYLTDMANRDRREVYSRLVVLIAHVLKWQHQPDRRSGGWQATIFEQRRELKGAASKGVLRRHADDVLADAYADAVEEAAGETGLPAATFPADCPYTFDDLLAFVPTG